MIRLLAVLFGLIATQSAALTCSTTDFQGTPYTVCEAAPAVDHITLAWADSTGTPYQTFDALIADAGPVAMAMNAGMFDASYAPIGLFIRNGTQIAPLVTRSGPGNFGMLPNGLLCIGSGWGRVMETLAYAAAPADCRFASQSGPMLVIGGDLHPRFLPDSQSRYVRNGVGTSADGLRVVFVISDRPVTFYDFARFFRDGLGLSDALYFDGNVSQLYAPSVGRHDASRRIGPMVVVAQ